MCIYSLPWWLRWLKICSLISGSGRSPGGEHGNPHQCSCLENPMDRGAWWDTVHGVTKEPDTTEVTEHKCMHVYITE